MKIYIIIIIVIIIVLTVTVIISLKHRIPIKSSDERGDKMSAITPDYKNSRYKEIYLAGGCFWGV